MELPKELAGGRPTYLSEDGFRCCYEKDRWCMDHLPGKYRGRYNEAKEVSLKTKVYSPHLCFWESEDVEVHAEKPVQVEQKAPSPVSDEPWVDPDFPPCAASFGEYAYGLKIVKSEVRGWAKDGNMTESIQVSDWSFKVYVSVCVYLLKRSKTCTFSW